MGNAKGSCCVRVPGIGFGYINVSRLRFFLALSMAGSDEGLQGRGEAGMPVEMKLRHAYCYCVPPVTQKKFDLLL
jgi:hypothetical protein